MSLYRRRRGRAVRTSDFIQPIFRKLTWAYVIMDDIFPVWGVGKGLPYEKVWMLVSFGKTSRQDTLVPEVFLFLPMREARRIRKCF